MTAVAPPRVRLNPPPPALMRMVNPLVRRLLTTEPFGRRIGKIAILEFTGRRTGRKFRVPAGLQLIDGVPTVFTSREWRLNFAGGAPVTVIQRAQERRGRGVLLDLTPEQRGTAMRKALDDGASPFDLGIKITRGSEASIDDLGAVGLSMIQFELEPPS